jgi:hypothetical protein
MDHAMISLILTNDQWATISGFVHMMDNGFCRKKLSQCLFSDKDMLIDIALVVSRWMIRSFNYWVTIPHFSLSFSRQSAPKLPGDLQTKIGRGPPGESSPTQNPEAIG